MKKKGVPPALPTPPRAGVVAVPKPPVPADGVWRYGPEGAARDWTVKVWDVAGSPGRLGVRIEAPSAILAEQLDLPKDRGLVVTEVFENSVAKKAGIKANDILLKINQQTVSNSADALKPLIDGIKADTAFDIVVLRRGKQETIKDVKLPEPVARVRAYPYIFDPTGQRAQIAITVTRTGDKMTLQRSEGSVVIVVNAETTGGRNQVTSISISEKGKEAKYQKLDEVPEAHRAKVQHMLQLLDAPLRMSQGQGADKGPGSTVDLYYVVPKVDGQQQFFYTPRTIVAPGQAPQFDIRVPALPQGEDLQRRLLNFDVQIQRSGNAPTETKP
jgi:membrane-associated protease RseP (regulator of RpoE activity)